jgi:hypothetical protein
MVRSALFAVVSLLLVPGVAGAALPKAHPPDVKALEAKGVEVDWPLTASVELSKAHAVAVSVRSRTPVTLSLVAVGRNGRPLRAVARKTVRTGTFEQDLFMARAQRLALRLDVGKQRYWSWIRVRDDSEPAVKCEHGTESTPTFEAPETPLRVGQRYRFRLRNPGACPAAVLSPDDQWLRPGATGGWEPVPLDCGTGELITGTTSPSICDRVGIYPVVGPGAVYEGKATVPVGLTPGHYLLRLHWRFDQPPLEREVDVVA